MESQNNITPQSGLLLESMVTHDRWGATHLIIQIMSEKEVIKTIYKVKISKIETVNHIGRTYEKTSDTGNKEDKGAVYQYVEYPTTKEVITTILKQEKEDIDISAIIKAINDL